MFFEIARIVKIKRPKTILLENVKGLLNHDSGKTFKVILQTLDELGYNVQWMVLNSKFFGVPQNRERVFIIGSLRGERRPEILPLGSEHEQNLEQSEKPVSTITTRYYKQGNSDPYISQLNTAQGGNQKDALLKQNMKIRRLTPLECERLQGFPDNWTEGFSDTQRYKMMGNAVTVNVIRALTKGLYRTYLNI